MMHKNYSTYDLRVKRTKKLILDALILLTIQKGFSAITVSDITVTAGINRTTFYRHYKDKYDLLNKHAQTLFVLLDKPQIPSSKEIISQDDYHLPFGLVKIFEHIRENAQFYRVIWGKQGDPIFTNRVRLYIQKRIRSSIPKHIINDEQRLDLFVTYSAAASFGAVLWWLEHDMPYSNEEMIRILGDIESVNLKNNRR